MAPIADQPKKALSSMHAAEEESSSATRLGLFWTVDTDLRVTAIHGSALSLVKIRVEEILGHTLSEILHANGMETPALVAHYKALEGNSQDFEGGWGGRRFEAHLEPLRSTSGEILGVAGMARKRLARRETKEAAIGSEAQFRALVESSVDMQALLSAEGTVLYANPAISRILGYSAEELARTCIFELLHPQELDSMRELFGRLLTQPETRSVCQFRARSKNGAWHCMQGAAMNLLAEPNVRAVVLTVTEITDRKRGEAERKVISEIIDALNVTSNLDELLVQIHGALKEVVYAENCFIALYDPQTESFRFPFFVDRYDTVPAPQKIGRSCTAYVFRHGWPMLITQKVFGEMVQRGDVELVGTWSPAWLGVPLRTPSAMLGVLVVQHYEDPAAYTERDLEFLTSVGGHIALAIERKQADDALRKQQEEHEVIFHSAPLMIKFKDCKNRILRANRTAAEALGMEVHQVEGRSVEELHPEYAQQYYQDDLEVIQSRKPKLGILEKFRLGSGEVRLMRTDKIPYMDSEGKIIGVIAFSNDVTERHNTKEALRRSEANNRSLIENAPYGICRVGVDDRILDANPALVDMLGYMSENELAGVNLVTQMFADPEEGRRLLHEASANAAGVECTWKKRDGASITVRLSMRVVQWAGASEKCYELIAENVSEQRTLETQLRQAVKMEAIGRLAGGVAHDFNNLLMVIKGHAELLSDRFRSDEWSRQKVEQVQRAADRAAALTRQLLAFSRMQLLQLRVMDLNFVVSEMGRLLPRLIGEDIDLTVRLSADLGRVRADQTQIEQVILNLAVNARDAMPDGGKLLIETANVELDEGYSRRHAPLAAGRYAMLAVTDSGIGMDAETQAHIFEPFFTTKEQGKGTGLGLATVYGVVKQCGGYVWVYSEKNHGTTFKIYLPRVDDPVEGSHGADATGETPKGRETILLAEDEDAVREIAREFLQLSGYTVLEAPDGASALALAEKHDGPIHLLVTDIIMPGMTGRELAQRLAEKRPEVKIVFMSGYTEYATSHQGSVGENETLLTKPFTRVTLARTVRDALSRTKPN
ncbi:MAG: PAS domain S-box protein [Candidatus Acidiferrales bacterium]